MIPLLIDVALVLLFALSLWIGWRRGFVASLAGLLSLLIALVGANLLARTLAPAVGEWIAPSVETNLVEQYNLPQTGPTASPSEGAASAENPDSDSESGLAGILERVGLGSIVSSITGAGQDAADVGSGLAKTAARFIGEHIAFWVLFFLFVILLRILLGIVIRLLDRVMQLPVLRLFNRTGGLLLGFVHGALILLLAACLIQLFSLRLPAHTIEQTYLLRFLLQANPFTALPV